MNQKQKDRLAEIAEELRSVLDDEREKLDNMSDSFQETERYGNMQEACDDLENVVDELDDLAQR